MYQMMKDFFVRLSHLNSIKLLHLSVRWYEEDYLFSIWRQLIFANHLRNKMVVKFLAVNKISDGLFQSP